MYAVIQTGGKQYRVSAGDVVQIEKLEGEIGAPIKFGEILFVSKPSEGKSDVWVGQPTVKGAEVETEIVGQGRGEKITIMKFKRRKQYRRTQGHRQFYTQVLVTSVSNGAGETAKLTAEEKKAKLESYVTRLKPMGPSTSPKVYVSKRTPMVASAQKTEAKKAAAPKAKAVPKTAAKKKTTKAKSE